MGDVEKLTGLSIVKMDILCQSETGKDGKREALFSYHIDTEEVMSAEVTATILLTETDTSMQILGYRPIHYHGVGSGCLFRSDLYHQTVAASEGTMKVTLFLERDKYDSTDFIYNTKEMQETDAKWDLSEKYLRHLQEIEGDNHSTKEYFKTWNKSESDEMLQMLREEERETVSDE